jgi:hypothetical protein
MCGTVAGLRGVNSGQLENGGRARPSRKLPPSEDAELSLFGCFGSELREQHKEEEAYWED